MSSMAPNRSSDAHAAYITAQKKCLSGSAPFHSPAEALLSYVGAFESKDAGFIERTTASGALIEIPMLKPNRLVGQAEIRAGHEQSFATIKTAAFEISPPAANDRISIAVGTLSIERVNGQRDTHPLSIVAETDSGNLRRLSLYFDARYYRLWSDKAIL